MNLIAQDINLENSTSPYFTIQNLAPSDYTTAMTTIAFGFAGVLSFMFLLWGGLQWITAGGDKDSIDKARRKIMGALLGLVIIFSSYVIANILNVLFNVNIYQFNIPVL